LVLVTGWKPARGGAAALEGVAGRRTNPRFDTSLFHLFG